MSKTGKIVKKTVTRGKKQEKKKPELKLSEPDKYVLSFAKTALANAKTATDAITGANLEISNLREMINIFDGKMGEFDKDIQAQFDEIQEKNDVMLDLLIAVAPREVFTKEILEKLDLEIEKETKKESKSQNSKGKEEEIKNVAK